MSKYFIHVEAVNLAQIIYDTHDISTIRGGSFVLLNAIDQLAATFSDRLTPISTAASQGLFLLESGEDMDAHKNGVVRDMLTFLNEVTEQHATFVAAIEEDVTGNFPAVLEKLHAQIRRQQWRLPTVRVPHFDATEQECFIDGWRPGVIPYLVDENIEGAKISSATHFRRIHGRSIKHSLFQRLLQYEIVQDNLCAQDLGQLTREPSKGILSGKMAFIHIDGNSFGRTRRDLCLTPESRTRFDNQIQNECRKPFLRNLLERAESDADFQTQDEFGNEALRIEVLLWGGDEVTLIVPAWKGFEVIEMFYAQAEKLVFDDMPLSHRAVIVFCHHNAPILQIRRLAEELLDLTKASIKTGLEQAIESDTAFAELREADRTEVTARLSNHQYGNALHYLVLESFDMLRGSLSQFLNHYYKGIDYWDLLLHAHQLDTDRMNLRVIQANVSRSGVLEIISALQAGDLDTVRTLRQQLIASVVPSHTQQVENALDKVIGSSPARWYLLADIWDYIPEWN